MVLNFHITKGKDDEITLTDILVPKGSRLGYGSILLKTLLKVAEKKKIKKIEGQLFYDDEEHRKIQIDFYRKFGFHVDLVKKILRKYYKIKTNHRLVFIQ